MFVPSFTVKESPKRLAQLRMNDIGLAIQCSTCQTAGVLGPSGSAIPISYYELAFRVTHFVCFGDDRVDNQKARAYASIRDNKNWRGDLAHTRRGYSGASPGSAKSHTIIADFEIRRSFHQRRSGLDLMNQRVFLHVFDDLGHDLLSQIGSSSL
jgi:hypothetical protein